MPSVLLDFSKTKVGGGLLVASATLEDLARPAVRTKYSWLDQAHIWISPYVRRNMSIPEDSLPGTVTFTETRASALAVFRRPRRDFDVRFTLFGPTYTGRLARREITGFAEITMLVPPSECNLPPERFSFRRLISTAVKRSMTRRSDLYVTETSAVADRMTHVFGVDRASIHVVPNRPHHMFLSQPIFSRPHGKDGELHVAYPTRAYPHKNLGIIGEAGRLFQERSGKRLVVHATLRDEEWQALPQGTRQWMKNHGEASAAQVLGIYRQVDAIFFPSLLEASSVTPLEANGLGLPLIASDRDFVRTSAQAAEWFEPSDPSSVADALVRFEQAKEAGWDRARAVAERYRKALQASTRTDAYLAIIDQELRSLDHAV